MSGSIDETIRLWDVETGAELRRFDGHTGGVIDVDISPDAHHIVSGAADGTVRVWDALTGDLLRQMIGHTVQINGVKFVGGTSAVWSSSDDGSIWQWLPIINLNNLLTWISDNRAVRALTCSEQQLYFLVDSCD